MTHTKGPWTVRRLINITENELPYLAITAKGKMTNYFELATIPHQTNEDLANFNLMAAAPEMLDLLESIYADKGYNYHKFVDQIKTTIQKAKGE